jgi:hypothetical protein
MEHSFGAQVGAPRYPRRSATKPDNLDPVRLLPLDPACRHSICRMLPLHAAATPLDESGPEEIPCPS